MSIEARIESLENAVVALTEVLKAATSGKAIVAATSGKAAASDDKKEEGEKTTTRRRAAAPKADKVPTVKALADFATNFLDEVEGREDDYNDRRSEIARLAKKFEVKRLSEVKEDERADVIEALKKFAEANPVEEDNGDDNGDDSGI